MSGTSGDGIDASIIRSDGKSNYEGILNEYYAYDKEIYENNLTSIISMIIKISKEREYQIDMSTAYEAIQNPNGLPVPVGMFLNSQKKKDHNKNLISIVE